MNVSKTGKNKDTKRIVSCFEWMDSLIAAVIAVVLLFTFFFRVVTVDGSSMQPNLYSGDRLVVSSYFYTPSPGDVVVLKRTQGLPEPIVKRVIAVGGQEVDIDYQKGIVYVDGEPLDESAYIQNGITHEPYTTEPLLEFPQVVPEGYIFVLGDNREISEDRDVYKRQALHHRGWNQHDERNYLLRNSISG